MSSFLRGYSQSEVLQMAFNETSEILRQWQAGADRPGIHVAEYCPVINQWHLLLRPWGDRQRSEVGCRLREKAPL